VKMMNSDQWRQPPKKNLTAPERTTVGNTIDGNQQNGGKIRGPTLKGITNPKLNCLRAMQD
jgi:hypothetical protein